MKIRKHPAKIVAHYLQQLVDNKFQYLPVLIVDGALTSIAGVEAVKAPSTAIKIARTYGRKLRASMKKKSK